MTTTQDKTTTTGKVSHLIIDAKAGTGKTTTLIEGLRLVKGLEPRIVPSPQQDAIWKKMKDGPKPSTICFVAFNKSIATELQERVPPGCEAMTMHSLGNKAVTKAFGRLRLNQYRTQDIVSELLERDIRKIRKYQLVFLKAVEELTGLAKMNLVDPEAENIRKLLLGLIGYYEIDTNGTIHKVLDIVPEVLKRAMDVQQDRCFDFNDMIWLPVALELPVQRYDMLLVDELQDLNRCQQALMMKAGERLILCGDFNQAIYGFAGADCNSIDRLETLLADCESTLWDGKTKLQGVERLPLTVTRRCGKAIVALASQIVKDFEAHESNPAGTIIKNGIYKSGEGCYRESVKDGDMILCRVNAPLVSQCFKFLRENRKANIQGRNIGQGLISTINRYQNNELAKELSQGFCEVPRTHTKQRERKS